MNPADYLKIFSLWNKFKSNHPKFPAFMKAASTHALKEGSVIEVCVITADGEKIESNIKITAADLELLEEVKKLQQ